LEVNSTDSEKLFWKAKLPVKSRDFQMVMIPPEAPSEGKYSKESKGDGQKFLI
jgi:hypothetical protein